MSEGETMGVKGKHCSLYGLITLTYDAHTRASFTHLMISAVTYGLVTSPHSPRGDLTTSGDILEVLRPYCSEGSHPGETRRTLLQLMERVSRSTILLTSFLFLFRELVHVDMLSVHHSSSAVSISLSGRCQPAAALPNSISTH